MTTSVIQELVELGERLRNSDLPKRVRMNERTAKRLYAALPKADALYWRVHNQLSGLPIVIDLMVADDFVAVDRFNGTTSAIQLLWTDGADGDG